MTELELEKEIGYIFNGDKRKLLRPLRKIKTVIANAPNEDNDLSIYMNDYINRYLIGGFSSEEFHMAMNNLYLLALLYYDYYGKYDDLRS